MVEMLYFTSRYSSQPICLAGLDIFWQIISKSFDSYPLATKEKLTRRYMDLLSGALESRNIDDPIKYANQLANEFNVHPACYYLQFLRKYIELFPRNTEETRYQTHKCTDFDIVKHLIEVGKFHETLLRVCTDAKNTGMLRNESVDMLVFLVMRYKDRVTS
jgi:hypothetical protein